jgi:predicted metal-dependent hydrolase
MDLFNHGYYWEAHEVWEGLWHACGRRGEAADFLKGLIHLAAAGVKVREGVPRGVNSHATRAAKLFRRIADAVGTEDCRYLGLRLGDLVHHAQQMASVTMPREGAETDAVTPVVDIVLSPA